MFNHNMPLRKLFIISFFLFAQLMGFTRLYRNETVWMVCFYSQVSKTGVKGYRIADAFSNSIVIYREIMIAAFGFLYVDDLQGTPLKYDLRLQGVPFFFLNTRLFGPF
jgi:hypothetical protein